MILELTKNRLLFVFFLSIAAPVQSADIVLQERIAAPGAIVRLGDVAEVIAESESERQRLMAMPLMPSPPPGQTRYLRRQSVRDLIQAQGEAISVHRFLGCKQVTVGDPTSVSKQTSVPKLFTAKQPLTQSRQEQASTGFRSSESWPAKRKSVWSRPLDARGRRAIELAIEEAIDRWLESQGRAADRIERGEVHVTSQVLSELREVEVQEFRIKPLFEMSQFEVGEHQFTVSPNVGGLLNDLIILVEFVARQFAVVTKQPLRRGDLLTASRVTIQPLPRGSRVEGAFDRIDDVLGLEASRSLQQGIAITRDNSVSPVLVRRGETVSVISGGEGVSVRIQAIAGSDGRDGELIQVEAFDRSERFEARVVGRGRLAVVSTLGGGPPLAGTPNRGGRR